MRAVALAKVWQCVWPTSDKAFACPGRATPAGHSAAALLGAPEGTGVGAVCTEPLPAPCSPAPAAPAHPCAHPALSCPQHHALRADASCCHLLRSLVISQAPLQRVTEPPRPPTDADRRSPPDGLRPDPLIVL